MYTYWYARDTRKEIHMYYREVSIYIMTDVGGGTCIYMGEGEVKEDKANWCGVDWDTCQRGCEIGECQWVIGYILILLLHLCYSTHCLKYIFHIPRSPPPSPYGPTKSTLPIALCVPSGGGMNLPFSTTELENWTEAEVEAETPRGEVGPSGWVATRVLL